MTFPIVLGLKHNNNFHPWGRIMSKSQMTFPIVLGLKPGAMFTPFGEAGIFVSNDISYCIRIETKHHIF